jgi:beta-galactosidase
MLEDAEIFCYAYYGNTGYFSLAYQGVYEAFLDCGIQADPIRLEHITDYKILYLPFPVSLRDEAVEKIIRWVEDGGVLISEGCLGFFSREVHAFEHQPSRGLDNLCGVIQEAVSFGPDRWHSLEFSSPYGRLAGGLYRQSYRPITAKVAARYDDEKIAMVENNYGKGKVRLIGTMVGYGYKIRPHRESLGFFASVLPFAGQTPLIRVDYNTGLIPRIWADKENTYLWCINQQSYPQEALLALDRNSLRFTQTVPLRGGEATLDNGLLKFDVSGKDAAIYRLV